MSRLLSALSAVALFFCAALGTAAETVRLMEAERIILQSADERAQTLALRDALREVFVRVSGDVNAAEADGAVQEALRNPSDLLARFGFGASEVMLPDAIGNMQPTFKLDVVFDGQRVRSALVDSGLHVWAARRPSVMIYLAAPNSLGNIDLLGEIAQADGVALLREQARQRGVPLQWPLLDLQDLSILTADDVWAGFEQPMAVVAERYNADAILGGYVGVQPDSGQWVGRWHFIFAGEKRTATFFGDTQQSVIAQGVGLAADAMAERYAVDHRQTARPMDISVLNVTNVQTHGAVRQYLRDVNGISQIQMLGIDGDLARYRLSVRAPESQLLDILALESRMQLMSDIGFGDDASALNFIWLSQ
ncbi:DUF2066 domain-containing protein [Salinispirillum sp. LH 10-3-1]|uniref:DUF2066 domain-containing protein n=1 Tax=Salinispirillum sp. LH 10-3-1 TaxID=2952525 RepID=A0AB38YCG0_9GAMM